RELEQLILLVVALPLEPVQLVIVAIGVVVSILGAAKLVAAQNHRHALREKQRGQKVPALPPAPHVDLRVVGPTLRPPVGGKIVSFAVAVVVAVGFILFLVVAE